MTRYYVHLTTVASTVVTVEADDKAAAVEAAIRADMPTICAQCAGWGRNHNLEIGDEWDVGDLDDSVYEADPPEATDA